MRNVEKSKNRKIETSENQESDQLDRDRESVMSRIQGDLKDRTLAFGQRVLNLIAELPHEPRGWVVSKQIGKSGTSIGANVWEADHALTNTDFAHKISLARKESSETEYWLSLIIGAELMPKSRCEPLLKEARELTMMLGTIVARVQRKDPRTR